MTEQESMVLSEVNSVPGLTIRLAFDKDCFPVGSLVMVEEWEVKMPVEKRGKYTPIEVKKTYPAMVEGYSEGDTVINLKKICPEICGCEIVRVTESLYRHGYYRLHAAKIVKEGENNNG